MLYQLSYLGAGTQFYWRCARRGAARKRCSFGTLRDGLRAKALIDELLKKQQSIELGETAAMTLAELGEYEQAAQVQRDVIAAAEKAGLRDVVRHMAGNLRLYERRQPCRTPFTDDELP